MKFKVGDFAIHKSDGIDNNVYVIKITKVSSSKIHNNSTNYDAIFVKELNMEYREWTEFSTGEHNFEEKSNYCDHCKNIGQEKEAWLWLI